MSWVDFTTLVAYFAAVVIVGLRSGRRGSAGFLIAERRLGPLSSAASICASKIGAGVFMTHIAYVYLFGTAAIWGFLGVTAGYIAFYAFAARLKRLADAGNYYTLSDYFVDRFGPSVGVASGASLAITYTFGLAGQLVGGAKILAELTGLGYGVGVSLMTVLIILYILVGGFAAVVYTDVLQYGAILVLTAILMVSLVQVDAGDWGAIGWSLKPSVSLALFFGATLVPFAAGDMWQRVYATRSSGEARRSLLYAIVMYLVFGVLLTSLGLLVSTMLPDADPDMALILAFKQFLPVGLVGAAGVAVYAALMSSADTNLYTASSIMVQDLHARAFPGASPEAMVTRIRIVALIVGLLALIVALAIPHLVRLGFLYLSMYASVGIMVVLSLLRPRCRPSSLVFGLVTGALSTLVGAVFVHNEYLIFTGAGLGLIVAVLGEVAAPRLATAR